MLKHVNLGNHTWIHTSKIKKNMLILKFHPGMKCLLVFFSFFHPRMKFHPCLFERVFTREISFRDEIIPVSGEMPLTVYKFLPRWNFIPGWTHPCQKGRDEITSRDETLKWVCFFLSFLTYIFKYASQS